MIRVLPGKIPQGESAGAAVIPPFRHDCARVQPQGRSDGDGASSGRERRDEAQVAGHEGHRRGRVKARCRRTGAVARREFFGRLVTLDY